MARRRRRLRSFAIVFLLVLAGVGVAIGLGVVSGPSLTPAQLAARAAAARKRALLVQERRAVTRAEQLLTVALPRKVASAAPTKTVQLFSAPLSPREVVGFVPYYSLSSLNASDFADASVLCYFGLELKADASLSEPVSWVPTDSGTFANFLSSARAANDEILLTVSGFDQSAIDRLVAHPQLSAVRLAGELAPIVHASGMNGVDLDIEGRGTADRANFVRFMAAFTQAFRAADPNGVIILNTYPQSAAGKSDFFNVTALAPYVDQFFVMEYAMQEANNASANSPVFSPRLGYSSVQTLLQYQRLVSPTKIILGLPFYGYDFSTFSGRPGAATVNADPEAVTYDAITQVGRYAYWDPNAESPFTVHQDGTQWHETYYDDPLSLALKVALAQIFDVSAIGVWHLGMEGASTSMLDAVDGGSAAWKGSIPARIAAASRSKPKTRSR